MNFVKMKNLASALLILFLVSLTPLFAHLTIDGEIRPRTEYRNGYTTLRVTGTEPHTVPELVTNQRSLVGFTYKTPGVTGRLSFQDVRTWGEIAPKKDAGTFHLKEAWFRFNLTDSLVAKLGRQILSYDDERILAATNWNNIGTQHDVALFKFKSGSFQSHIGLAYNNETGGNAFESGYPVTTYKALSLIWGEYVFENRSKLSFIGLSEWNAKDALSIDYFNRYTYGIYTELFPFEGFKLISTLHLQNGKNKTGQEVNADLISVRGDYSLTDGPTLFSGTDIYSGNDPFGNTPANETRVFDRIYGAKHKFLGYMDYFPANTYGIHDIFAGSKMKTGALSFLEAKVHAFLIPHEFTNPNTGNTINKYLGTEIDLKYGYKVTKELSFTILGGIMLAGESMEIVKNGGNHESINTFVAMYFTYKPKFKIN